MSQISILVVDDEENLLLLLERILLKEGYMVFKASNGLDACTILEKNKIDIVLTDIRMPGMTGMELLQHIKNIDSNIEIIMMTAFATVDTAIESLKIGARDYIRKPFDIEEVVESIKKTTLILEKTELGPIDDIDIREMLVANSSPMKDLVKMIKKVANSVATVYIQGETGVGKELVARGIHESSDRKDMAFVKVNCSALPETLLESELFGYEKGAFTGAFSRKLGRFELANGGTIFLDEIGDISPLIQLKLLRIIQQKEFERLGGTETLPLDVRIITATNKNLENLVELGSFREDLYYRLNVIPMSVPPLRDRKMDIEELITIFMKTSSNKHQTPLKKIDEDTLNILLNYSWPGNVRELENIIERIIVISDGDIIQTADLPPKMVNHTPTVEKKPLVYSKDIAEEKAISQALKDTNGNITHAAENLGISRRSLHRKINKYNINI